MCRVIKTHEAELTRMQPSSRDTKRVKHYNLFDRVAEVGAIMIGEIIKDCADTSREIKLAIKHKLSKSNLAVKKATLIVLTYCSR